MNALSPTPSMPAAGRCSVQRIVRLCDERRDVRRALSCLYEGDEEYIVEYMNRIREINLEIWNIQHGSYKPNEKGEPR